MNEADVKAKIEEVNSVFENAPTVGKSQLDLSEGTYVPSKSTTSCTAEDALDHLRLQVKYLVFDLEATKRENKYLRQMLQRRAGGDNPGE